MPTPQRDLELGEKARSRERKGVWGNRLSAPTLSFRRSTSASSAKSPTSSESIPTDFVLTDDELRRQDSLILLIVGDQLVKGTLADACTWYARYLLSKFVHHWHLLAPSLKGLDEESTRPRTGELVIVYDFLIIVARLLKTKKDLALVEIVDDLDNRDLLKPQFDEERALPNQIVFAALGWLSMFYDAVSHPKTDKLEVTKTSTSISGCRNPLITKKYCTFKQGFDYIDLPIYTLLGRFGDLIPEARPHQGSPLEVVMVQSVCYNTLQYLAELKIEWVTSLTLHLELDSGKRTLKLFQFPSFCRMMYVEGKSHIMSRLLNDHAARSCEDVRTPDVSTEEFFQEILLSYRLIFGQDERSWKSFARMIPVWEEQRGSDPWESSWNCDPLLQVLCGGSSTSENARRLYDEIDACEPESSYYDPNTEFPFFGRRLIELQQFVKQHQPQTVRSLLNDRRDLFSWWTLWNNSLLFLFASCTIFLMIVSLIFQIWQVALARQQLRQGQP